MSKKYLPLASLLCLYAISVSNADAKCSEAAIRGRWYGSIAVVNAQDSSNNYSAYCELDLRKGVIPGMVGSCTALSSNPAINGSVDKLVNANLIVAPDCSVTGSVTSLLGGRTEVHGHLNKDRTAFVSSFQNSTGGVGSMSFIK